MGRPKSVDIYIKVGIKEKTRDKLDRRCFNLNVSRGEMIDMVIGGIPPTRHKLNPNQRKMMRLSLIRAGKKFQP